MTVFSRRGLFVGMGSLLLGGALVGCSVTDPLVHGGSQTPPPLPTPSPVPTLADVAGALQWEADLAGVTQELSGAGLGAPITEQVTAFTAAHQAHLLALASPDPVARPTATPTDGRTPRPVPSASATLGAARGDAAITQVRDLYGRAVAEYQRRALEAEGQHALVWGSLMAYASGAQAALEFRQARPAPPANEPRPLQVWSDVEAMQQVLRQVHGLIYGYQAALAPMTGNDTRTVSQLLNEHRALRTRLGDLLRERNEQVPAAEAAYKLPVEPTDRANGAKIIATMEGAFRPFAGGWVAAATDGSTRELAVQTLQGSARTAAQWGGDLPIWPGFAH